MRQVNRHSLWVEKYRPKSLEQCILPRQIHETFRSFVREKFVPNIIVHGPSGTGKTSALLALMHDLNANFMFLNGSLDGQIDRLRTEVRDFVMTRDLNGRKYVIYDEADHLNRESTQAALRTFMEDYAKTTGFLFSANDITGIIPALQSRSSVISFEFPRNLISTPFGGQMIGRIVEILDAENINFDPDVLRRFFIKRFPDLRGMINTLQAAALRSRTIDQTLLEMRGGFDIGDLLYALKMNDWPMMRQWVSTYVTVETQPAIFRALYEILPDVVSPKSLPQAIVTLGDWHRDCRQVIDLTIHMTAMLTIMMTTLTWRTDNGEEKV